MTATARRVADLLYGADHELVWPRIHPPEDSIEGWNGQHEALLWVAQNYGPILVDVGVWKGQSTLTMAGELRRCEKDACVIAVDTFLGSADLWDKDDFVAMSSPRGFDRYSGMPDLYGRFLSNVGRADLKDFVVPMPQTSTIAAAVLKRKGIRPNAVHIDASHDYESVLFDAQIWWGILAPGGVLIGDDYDECHPALVAAVNVFAAEAVRPIETRPPKWIVKKPL